MGAEQGLAELVFALGLMFLNNQFEDFLVDVAFAFLVVFPDLSFHLFDFRRRWKFLEDFFGKVVVDGLDDFLADAFLVLATLGLVSSEHYVRNPAIALAEIPKFFAETLGQRFWSFLEDMFLRFG